MTALTSAEATRLTRRALRLTQFTIVYNVLEGVLSTAAGVTAGLVSVVGFGIDSGIESAVAVLVALRLTARLRGGHADERREKLTLRLIGITFFALAAYLVIDCIRRHRGRLAGPGCRVRDRPVRHQRGP